MDSILRILFSIFFANKFLLYDFLYSISNILLDFSISYIISFAISIRIFSNAIISINMQLNFKIYISPNSIELWYISMEL